MKIIKIIILFLILCQNGQADSLRPIERKEVLTLIDEMVTKYQFNRKELTTLFGKVQFLPEVVVAMSRPAERKLNWTKYRKIFLKKKRIKQGAQFWKKYKNTLMRAEKEYGVPAEIIVAIIGVETYYGRYTGKHKVIDSLTTLAFNYPRRGKFFRSELVHFLRLNKEENIDPLTTKGSYAGAVGLCQFISSSYRNYAVDFDADGQRNLWDAVDAIGSVANYFKRHGWKKDDPIVSTAQVGGKKYQALLKGNIKPKDKLSKIRKKGVVISKNWAGRRQGKLMQFKLEKGNEYWVGLNNFYVITRYNHSQMYALAAYQLSEDIKAKYSK